MLVYEFVSLYKFVSCWCMNLYCIASVFHHEKKKIPSLNYDQAFGYIITLNFKPSVLYSILIQNDADNIANSVDPGQTALFT